MWIFRVDVVSQIYQIYSTVSMDINFESKHGSTNNPAPLPRTPFESASVLLFWWGSATFLGHVQPLPRTLGVCFRPWGRLLLHPSWVSFGHPGNSFPSDFLHGFYLVSVHQAFSWHDLPILAIPALEGYVLMHSLRKHAYSNILKILPPKK